MPVFDTPESITVTMDLGVAAVWIAAGDRADTVVEVRPSNAADESDVQAAAQVRVDFANGALQVTGPRRAFDFSKKSRSVDVSIELPSDSQLSAHLLMGGVSGTGRLGETQVKTTGDVRLERTGPLRLHTGVGHVAVDGVTGDAEISTGSGTVRVGAVEGAVAVKNSNGNTTIDAASGDVRVRNANGAVEVTRAGAGVDAKTSNGGIRVGEVARGSVVLRTAMGDLDIGVAPGTAAWLEVNTGFGQVHNLLENTARPGDAEETVEVRGSTSYGDITIRRS
ncbi:DUF4097 family beta strand repeat-containing protein [Micromonospora sp. WMMD975]|uniref:DUF4097 family beta strand repeat-containing protein n=1 Tax=Micromonospora sp. WMMD975 TaxID=3016087 RepID=UPI00249B30C9|nr:DUF4097 family beta strand repeat-containing protein [Micromonospora sp. WMMD975]WFE32047.1 DUF4097 family beta strand repeat-containing protein [Micromonospora sp. WMMD975]